MTLELTDKEALALTAAIMLTEGVLHTDIKATHTTLELLLNYDDGSLVKTLHELHKRMGPELLHLIPQLCQCDQCKAKRESQSRAE